MGQDIWINEYCLCHFAGGYRTRVHWDQNHRHALHYTAISRWDALKFHDQCATLRPLAHNKKETIATATIINPNQTNWKHEELICMIINGESCCALASIPQVSDHKYITIARRGHPIFDAPIPSHRSCSEIAIKENHSSISCFHRLVGCSLLLPLPRRSVALSPVTTVTAPLLSLLSAFLLAVFARDVACAGCDEGGGG